MGPVRSDDPTGPALKTMRNERANGDGGLHPGTKQVNSEVHAAPAGRKTKLVRPRLAGPPRRPPTPRPASCGAVQAALQSSAGFQAARTIHEAVAAALDTLAAIHGREMAQTLVGEILSSDPPPALRHPHDPEPAGKWCPLGPEAARVFAAMCRHYQVEPGAVLRSIVEQFLADACEDASLAPCVAREAREIARVGRVPASWWQAVAYEAPNFAEEEAAV